MALKPDDYYQKYKWNGLTARNALKEGNMPYLSNPHFYNG